MKSFRFIFGSLLFLSLTAGSIFAQEFTLTTTAANTVSSKASIDMPGLTGNALAIIVATPLGSTADLNPNPIGAWYYSGKWNIFNSNHSVMPLGAKYKVQFFKQRGPNQFLHVVTEQNLGSEGSYIDSPALNDNPNAQVQILQNHAPDDRSPYNLNRFAAKASYSSAAGRWYISNINDQPIPRASAYNVVVSSGGVGSITNPQPPKTPETVAKTPDAEKVATPETNPVIKPVQPGTKVAIPTETNPVIKPAEPGTKVRGPAGPGTPPVKVWTLREELPLTIAPNAQILLFIHGMDSRAEEADDITRALFAEIANPRVTQPVPPPPPVGGPQNPQMVTFLQKLLQKYKGCILERYETQQDMRNRGMAGTLSGLWNTNGLQDRDVVICVAGNPCSRLSRTTALAALQAQANRGELTNFQANIEKAIPKDCFDCQKHQEWHTKHVHCTMEVGGNSGIPKGPIFEGCKAGVDMEKLAGDVVKEIKDAISNVSGIVTQTELTGGPTIATNFSTVRFTECANPAEGCPETCDHNDNPPSGAARAAVLPQTTNNGQKAPLYFVTMIPQGMLDTGPPPNQQFNVPTARNIGSNEGRLRPDLRKAAADANPLQSLRLATYQFAAGNTELGKAFADLSVTGHQAFADFRLALPQESFCQSLSAQRPPQLSESVVLGSCRTALDRAYEVANFLRTGQRGDTPAEKTRKTKERIALGWIAVSGEDDSPHRPVNVISSDFPQYNIDVNVEAPFATGSKSVTVRTRYVIAQSPAPNGNPAKNLVVISLDLPSSGYSTNLDYEDVSPLAEIGSPKWTQLPVPLIVPLEVSFLVPGLPPGLVIPAGTPLPDFQATGQTPLLDFMETFIVRFAEAVHQKVPIKDNIKAVMGGSLGGNMTFRLGRRTDTPWLPKFIVWSPASIWYSMGEGPDIFKHFGPRSGWESANAARNTPRENDRALFFGGWDKDIIPLLIPMAQSETWTSNYYPCKKSSVAAARLDRHETYDARFLAWRWRLGTEQLLYSHHSIDPATNRPRYMSNNKPMLLACGTEDHVKFNDICPATQRTAPLMTITPGKAIFLDKTGHSLDNERRIYFARQVIDFLGLQ